MADKFDPVEEASEESFPASDAPGWAMGEDTQTIAITNHPSRHRFEATVGADTARLDYRIEAGEMALLHTEVPASMRDLGMGGKLAHAALDFARREKLRVNPLCPFVAKYVERHPEYADLVATRAKSRGH